MILNLKKVIIITYKRNSLRTALLLIESITACWSTSCDESQAFLNLCSDAISLLRIGANAKYHQHEISAIKVQK